MRTFWRCAYCRYYTIAASGYAASGGFLRPSFCGAAEIGMRNGIITLRKDAHDVQWKAALQPHIGA